MFIWHSLLAVMEPLSSLFSRRQSQKALVSAIMRCVGGGMGPTSPKNSWNFRSTRAIQSFKISFAESSSRPLKEEAVPSRRSLETQWTLTEISIFFWWTARLLHWYSKQTSFRRVRWMCRHGCGILDGERNNQSLFENLQISINSLEEVMNWLPDWCFTKLRTNVVARKQIFEQES